MSTTYHPARGASPAPVTSRYVGAAAIVSAIKAAAEVAPEVHPAAEFPERYGATRYPHTEPAQHETGAALWVGAVTYTIENGQRIGRDARERIETDGPSCHWPRVDVHPETPGPFLPPRTDAKVTFHYSASGARGSLTVENRRPALLALADKVQAQRLAFDGKPKRARCPVAVAGSKGSAPHIAARAMWEARDYAGALALAGNVGALFFGVPGRDGAPFPYMMAESIEAAGQTLTIARSIQTGRFRILHTASACAVDSAEHGAPAGGFTSRTIALAWIEGKATDADWCGRLDAAIAKAAGFDQARALAHYVADPEPAAEAPEPAPDAPEPAAPDVTPMEAAPAAPAPRYSFETYLIGTDSKIIESGRHECTGPGLTTADQEAAGATLRAMAEARGLRVVSTGFAAYGLRAWCEPMPKPAPVRYVSPAEFAHTVALAQLRAAAADLARASLLFPPDAGRATALAEARAGNLQAAPAVLAHLQRIAEHGRTADSRRDAAETARALADAMAEHARESAPSPATHSDPGPLPTHSEPEPRPCVADYGDGAGLDGAQFVTRARAAYLLRAARSRGPGHAPRRTGLHAYAIGNSSLRITTARACPPPTQSEAKPPATHSEPRPTMRDARAAAVLDRLIRCDGVEMTRRAFVELKVREGLRPTCEIENRVKPLSRRQMFRATNEEQRAHDARIKAAGTKEAFYLGGYAVTKIEHDYAAALGADLALQPPATHSAPAAQAATLADPVPPATHSGPFRISALNTMARENRGVHVLFSANRDRSGPYVGFYMSAQTYASIPLGVEATPADYERFGVLEPAPATFYYFGLSTQAAPAEASDPIKANQFKALAIFQTYVQEVGATGRVPTAAMLEAEAERIEGAAVAMAGAPGVAADYAAAAVHFREAAQEKREREAAPADSIPGLDVCELGPDALAAFEPERAAELSERARASVAAPIPSLRIPAGDPRLRIPRRFAPVYVLQA